MNSKDEPQLFINDFNNRITRIEFMDLGKKGKEVKEKRGKGAMRLAMANLSAN